MRKRSLALLLALLLALTGLSGCVSRTEQAFYDQAEEMAATEDAMIDLLIPYHDMTLSVSGYLCRSAGTADLTVSLMETGTENGDGTWTELRINGNQFWLNVKQISDRTLSFGLSELRQQDIQLLAADQRADWMSYTWSGDFWSGIPEWSELFSDLWESVKEDLNGHITGSEDSYTLELSGSAYTTAITNLLTGLTDQTEAFSAGFVTFLEEENELVQSTQLEASELFSNEWGNWADWLSEIEDGTDTTSQLTVELTRSDSSYGLAGVTDTGESWSLTVTPLEEPLTPEEPSESMEFGAYADAWYYLVEFSQTYITDLKDGVTQDAESAELEDSYHGTVETTTELQPMTTAEISEYDDLTSVQFLPTDGEPRTVPVLRNYQSNSVSSENDTGELINDLVLYGSGWYFYLYSESGESDTVSQFLEDSIRSYYDAYVDVSGYLLVQDLTEQSVSGQGCAAQGFSYRINNYSDPIMLLMIVLPREGSESYTVLSMELHLSEMSQEDKDAVTHLYEYLGLELTLDLNA